MTTLKVYIDSMSHPRKSYSDDLMKNIEFECISGDIVSILGPSGAGKTTLLRIIAGLETGYVGEILLNGIKIEKPTRRIQVVFQDNKLFPWLNVFENMKFAKKKGDQSCDVERNMQLLGLAAKQHSFIKELSGGEEARVSLGRTLVDAPDILLMDEPLNNLDIRTKRDMQEKLLSFHENNPEMIIIMVSHSIEDSLSMSDKLFIYSSRPMTLIQSINNMDREQIGANQLSERKKEIESLLLQ